MKIKNELVNYSKTSAPQKRQGLGKSKFSNKPKLALVQHPMWFLVGEDRITASRTPPWGSKDLQDYSERVRRNLDSLQKNPKLKVNFDFSSVELEDLYDKYPDLGDKIRKFVIKGQLGFVNGTYSQPHMHTLSLEANIRQLEIGLKVIKQLTGYQVKTHAMQEPDYSDQTVQLLKAFGFQFVTRGEFVSGLLTETNPLPKPSTFYWWKGLDGSKLALVSTFSFFAVDPIRTEEITLTTPDGPVAIKYPDMEEFHPNPELEYVLLDEIMPQQIKKHPPTLDVRIYLPWGYVEGTRAEELMRENVAAETVLLQAETLEALSILWSTKSKKEMEPLWKLWLKAQHHDAYWADGPELRSKSIRWCQQSRKGAETIIQSRMKEYSAQAGKGTGKQNLLLFSVNPLATHSPTFAAWKGKAPKFWKSLNGNQCPVQVSKKINSQTSELLFLSKTNGAESVLLSPGNKTNNSKIKKHNLKQGWQYQNSFYSATLTDDGSFRQIQLNEGPKLIDIPAGWGGQLSALLKKSHTLDRFEKHISSAVIEQGPVADIVDVKGKIGPINITRRIYFYHDLPWFESTVECDFPLMELGDFSEDNYKLCYWWPAWLRNNIVHGVPGGAISADYPEICFYPVNWMDIRLFNINYTTGIRQEGGIAIANRGTLKGFRRQGRIGLVLAWGTKENDFGNRTNSHPWAKKMDLRLKGKHLFHFALYPHKGDWKENNIPQWANGILKPSVVYPCLFPEKPKKVNQQFVSLKSESLVPTAIIPGDKEIRVRFYESKGINTDASFYLNEQPVAVSYKDAAGNPMRTLKPWFIGEAVIKIKS